MKINFQDTSLDLVELLTAVAILAGIVVVLMYLLPTPILVLGGLIIGFSTGIYVIGFFGVSYGDSLPGRISGILIWSVFLVPIVITAVFLNAFGLYLPLINGVLLVALLLSLLTYWLVVPAALYGQLREQNQTVNVNDWPSITVLIPAYNEEGYVGQCINSFLTVDYPSDMLEVVVIDDGSTDRTYEEATDYTNEIVTVFTKENGGKHSALNYGLKRTNSTFIVCVDADSAIRPQALKELIRTYKSAPDAGAVAGNVKVENSDSFITEIQALEYIIGINMFRRALSQLGLVKVVPGCLGMFDRELVTSLGGYSGDTVTEDFDLTLEILKQGRRVYHSGDAVVSTEVPSTWSDLYRQRIRWFRGNVQTVLKHWKIFTETEFGLLHAVMTPYFILSMVVIPGLGFVILGFILWMIISGAFVEFLALLVLFTFLQLLFCTLAVLIEEDDLSLVKYAPLTVIGYKQFLDSLLAKGTIDVLFRNNFTWTSANRVRQRNYTKCETEVED